MNNLGRIDLTGHIGARSIPEIGGERALELVTRYRCRCQFSDPNRPRG